MKTLFATVIMLFAMCLCNSQEHSVEYSYLDQTLPGETPELFAPGIVSTDEFYEFGIAFSSDGNEMFFTIDSREDIEGIGLQRLLRKDGEWGSPVTTNLRGISAWEFEAFYKYTGDTLFFTSRDEKSNGKDQFYYSIKNGDNWGTAQKLDSPVNDTKVMWCSFPKSGNMYFTNETSEKICFSEYVDGGYPKVQTICSGMHPYVSHDESYFLYDNNGSIYLRFKKQIGNAWHSAIKLNSLINSTRYEGCPSLSPDEKYLFFSRYINKCDIYWVDAAFIEEFKTLNKAPYLYNTIPDTIVSTNNVFAWDIDNSIFFDDDGNSTLQYSATLGDGSELPLHISFNATTKTIESSAAGEFTIKITATDTAGASISDKFNFEVKGESNLQVSHDLVKFKIFPNPTIGYINVDVDESCKGVSYRLFNTEGRMVKQGKLNDNTIDISNLGNGIYMLSLSCGNRVWNQKIINAQ